MSEDAGRLATVILALVLFVVGIASKLRQRNVRLWLASFATLCLAAGVSVLLFLQAAWP
jgi:NADH:ubiquinone oxidoreductase subunit K